MGVVVTHFILILGKTLVHVYVCKYTYMYVCMYMYIYMYYMHMYVYNYVQCTCTCMCVLYIYVCTVYACIHVCMHMYLCIYMYIHFSVLISLYGAPLAQIASYLAQHNSLFGPDGAVNYDYIVTDSINSFLLIGLKCIPNGAHTNHC